MSAFTLSKATQRLDTNAHWNNDGTIRTTPQFFYQSYSIHVWNDYNMKSMICAALPDKKFNTYDMFLKELV